MLKISRKVYKHSSLCQHALMYSNEKYKYVHEYIWVAFREISNRFEFGAIEKMLSSSIPNIFLIFYYNVINLWFEYLKLRKKYYSIFFTNKIVFASNIFDTLCIFDFLYRIFDAIWIRKLKFFLIYFIS